MAFVETLRLVLDADIRGGVTQVERFGKTAERAGMKAEQSLDKLGNRMTAVGTGMVAVGTAALFGLGKAAMASEEANLAVVKLENTIANMPALAGESSKQFIDLAESIQDVTAADADQIVAAEAMLGTFQLTADEIKNITPLVVDYSRKFGVDMVSAATQVGKALDGQVGALKRNGVSIDEALFATDRYAAVQKALSEQVGGFAEAEGKTFAGSLERLKNQMGDLAEGVGVGAVDAFSDLFAVVQPVIDGFNDLDPGIQSTVGKVATFGSVALVAAGGLSILVGQVIKARDNFRIAADAAGTFASKIPAIARAAGPLAIVAAGVGAIGAVADKVFPGFEADIAKLTNDLLDFAEAGRVIGELSRLAGDDLGTLGDAFKEIVDTSAVDEWNHAWGSMVGAIPGVHEPLEEARNRIDDLDKALAELAQRDPETAARVFERLTEALAAQGISADDVRGQLDDYANVLVGLDTTQRLAGDSASEAAGGVGEFGEALDEETEAAQRAEEAIANYANEMRAMFDPLFGMQDALRANQEAAAELRTKHDELAEAVRTYGADSDEAREAQEAYTSAQTSARDAAIDLWGAALTLRAEVENNGLSADAARRQFITMATQMGYTSAQAEAMAGDMGFAASEARRLGDSDPTVVLTTRGFQESLQNIYNVRAAVSSIPRSIQIEVNFHTTGTPVVRRQFGGRVEPGRLYQVNEAGVELFSPDVPGTMIPHNQVGRYMTVPSQSYAPGSWGAGATTVVEPHFHFHGPVASQPDAERWVATAWNRAAERNLVNVRGRRP